MTNTPPDPAVREPEGNHHLTIAEAAALLGMTEHGLFRFLARPGFAAQLIHREHQRDGEHRTETVMSPALVEELRAYIGSDEDLHTTPPVTEEEGYEPAPNDNDDESLVAKIKRRYAQRPLLLAVDLSAAFALVILLGLVTARVAERVGGNNVRVPFFRNFGKVPRSMDESLDSPYVRDLKQQMEREVEENRKLRQRQGQRF